MDQLSPVTIAYSGLPGAFRRLERQLGLSDRELRLAAIKGRLEPDGHQWNPRRDKLPPGNVRLENGEVWPRP